MPITAMASGSLGFRRSSFEGALESGESGFGQAGAVLDGAGAAVLFG